MFSLLVLLHSCFSKSLKPFYFDLLKLAKFYVNKKN